MSRAASSLRLVPSQEARREPAVVGEILADGTIRSTDPGMRSRVTEATPGWASGSVSTDQWMLWWERRGAEPDPRR